jgi:hypothetical protein
VGFKPGGPVAECKFYNHPGNKGCSHGGSCFSLHCTRKASPLLSGAALAPGGGGGAAAGSGAAVGAAGALTPFLCCPVAPGGVCHSGAVTALVRYIEWARRGCVGR